MIVGFNHNMTHRGVSFHVQTEDSGIKSPHLITLLYYGGTIISSQKTSYADILNVDNLELVIEDLAKDQHKGMLKRLKKGEFDQRILEFGIPIKPIAQPEQAQEKPEETAAEVPLVAEPIMEMGEVAAEPGVDFPEPEDITIPEAAEQAFEENLDPGSKSTDLDDLIFSYLSGDDGKE